jgi:hypothetical protein
MIPVGSKRGLIMLGGSLGLITSNTMIEYRLDLIEFMALGRTFSDFLLRMTLFDGFLMDVTGLDHFHT